MGECKPVSCEDGISSFGRRRRDTELDLLGQGKEIIFDEKLNQEVLDVDTDLVKEIFVESGTTVERLTLENPGDRSDYPAGSVHSVRGELDSDIVCTSWPVVLAASAGVVFLQLCIIATCLTCLYTSHKQLREKMKSTNQYPQYSNER